MLHTSDHFTTIIDAACGCGKSHRMLQSLRPDHQYLLVTPRISETYRFADRDETTGDELPEHLKLHPEVTVHLTKAVKGTKVQPRSKTTHLKQLLAEGKSVAVTHALFDRLKDAADAHLLAGVDLVIDENPDPIEIKNSVTRTKLKTQLLGHGYATLDPKTNQLRPTEKWHSLAEVRFDNRKQEHYLWNEMDNHLYEEALAGRLVCHEDSLFVVACPPEVLLGGRSLTLLTFMSEGGYMRHYLEKLGETFPKAKPHVRKYMTPEFIRRATELVTAEVMPTSLRKLGFDAQEKLDTRGQRRLGLDIRNFLRKQWADDYAPDRTAFVCARSRWHSGTKKVERVVVEPDGTKRRKKVTVDQPSELAKETRLYRKGTYVSSKTRGINGLSHINRMVYCYDMHPNPKIADFLGCNNAKFSEEFAIAEAVQVVWRMAQRKFDDPQPVKVAFASKRMLTLFKKWQQSLIEDEEFSDEFLVIE